MTNQKRTSAGRLKHIGRLFAATLICSLVVLYIPWNAWALTAHPHPVQSYEDAAKQLEALRTARESEMNPECLLQFLTYGQKVQHAIVLVHGYTSCPAQFSELGKQFYGLGYNVLIAPLPHHGLANRLNDEQGQLADSELTAYADKMVDLAHGMGEQVTMIGISGGGVVTAWAAQNRSDLDTAMIISPAFGYQEIPTPLTAPVMNVILNVPDTYDWWDANLKADVGPSHAYPRYSKHALAEFLKVGFSVQVKSWQTSPAAHRVIVVTNASDTSVNNNLTLDVVRHWQNDGAHIETYEFPLSLGLGHDLIDPAQPDQAVEIVYPILIELITQAD
jgi:alpha-beta hydrolase superfamily lysophospholipase